MDYKVYIFQDGYLPPKRIIEELERKGGININRLQGNSNGNFYFLDKSQYIKVCYSIEDVPEGYSELRYSPEPDAFYIAVSPNPIRRQGNTTHNRFYRPGEW